MNAKIFSRAVRGAVLPALILVATAFFVFEGYVFRVQGECDAPLPRLFGNFLRNREYLERQPSKDTFAFAVVGDTRSNGTFEQICRELRATPLDFAVLLGDCAQDANESDHRYFRAECADEYALPFPVFYVVGNHDVSPDRFPVARFEDCYGPSIFSFNYQDCLFIVLRILDEPGSNRESLDFLRKIAKERPQRFRKRFVFMHIPPAISPDVTAREYSEGGEVMDLFDKLQIDYVFAGDFHGYGRTQRNRTNYIVTGGGGAHLNEKVSRRQFHHAMVLRVRKDAVDERIIAMPRRVDFEDRLENLAVARLYPWMAAHKPLVWAINMLVGAALFLAGTREILLARTLRVRFRSNGLIAGNTNLNGCKRGAKA